MFAKVLSIFEPYRAVSTARPEKWIWTNVYRRWHGGTASEKKVKIHREICGIRETSGIREGGPMIGRKILGRKMRGDGELVTWLKSYKVTWWRQTVGKFTAKH